MPERSTIVRAQRDKAQGKAPSTQAGEFVREEMHHIREGKHGARSSKQAIAIGLNTARRAGVDLEPPKEGSEQTKRSARSATRRAGKKVSARRSRAASSALQREGRSAASHTALARQGRSSARGRTSTARSGAAQKAARTKGATGRSAAARKAAGTRQRHS